MNGEGSAEIEFQYLADYAGRMKAEGATFDDIQKMLIAQREFTHYLQTQTQSENSGREDK